MKYVVPIADAVPTLRTNLARTAAGEPGLTLASVEGAEHGNPRWFAMDYKRSEFPEYEDDLRMEGSVAVSVARRAEQGVVERRVLTLGFDDSGEPRISGLYDPRRDLERRDEKR